MSLRSLLYKELRWLRHNAGTVVLVLVVLPAIVAAGTVAFQQVIPRDTPVALVPADESVTEDDMTAMRGVTTFFAEPHSYGVDEREQAMRALTREEVYAVFVVPPDLLEADADVTVEMYVEEEMVPYEQPSLAIAGILRVQAGQVLPADVAVERTAVGEDRTLSEFLVSVGAMLVTMLFAFAYVPYVVADEQRVFRRIRVESSLWQLLASKFVVLTPLLLVPVATFQAIAWYLEFSVDLVAPGAVGVTLLTFVYLTAISLGVMFLTRFRTVGRMVNVTLMFVGLAFSNLVYPAGFFSPLRREIAKASPLHYSMVVQRGAALKGQGVGTYADYLLGLGGVTALSLLFLTATVVYYDRGGYRG
ncbi:ABC transporter permease [Haloarcula laminariae]|uniref:ABC transporter permease n=1 Tax=Haloarcula laminariae TaxID=2961577 RepID=UPI0021C72F32|nr:ABC transporter permease [Halomicroarcula laminariae]